MNQVTLTGATTVLLLLMTALAHAGETVLGARMAMQPRIVQFAYPGGSLMSYGLEITEDSNGDGVYDTRYVREHDGRWIINCWPAACDRRVVEPQPILSSHHDFIATYNQALGIFTWELREYKSARDQVPVAVLMRRDAGNYHYARSQDAGVLPEHQSMPRVTATTDGTSLTLTYTSQTTARSLISIMNMQGRAVARKAYTPVPENLTTVTIPLSGIPAGTHSVWVSTETSIHATQFTLR